MEDASRQYVLAVFVAFTLFMGSIVILIYKIVHESVFKRGYDKCNKENRGDIIELKAEMKLLIEHKKKQELFAEFEREREFKRNI